MAKPLQVETLPQLVIQAAQTFPDQAFLEDEEMVLSFQGFAQRCLALGDTLISCGIEKGDKIGIWAPNSIEWVIAAMATQCAGAVLVTLNTRYKGAEAAYILRKSRTKLLFSVDQFLGTDYLSQLLGEDLPHLETIVRFTCSGPSSDPSSSNLSTTNTAIKIIGKNHYSWKSLIDMGNVSTRIEQRMATVTGNDCCDILFTSGTTGDPKGVVSSHQQNIKAFTSFSDILGLTQGDRYLVINPFFHSFGYKAGILACLLKGVTLIPHAVFDAGVVLQRIVKDRISVLPGPPTLFQSLLAHPRLNEFDLSTLKRATTGAAIIPVALIEQMKSVLGFDTIITAYGLTESCGLVSMCRQGDSDNIIATTSGRAIPDVELRCVDTNNKPLPSGLSGEIVVRGYNIMQGYFEDEAATKQSIDADGWLHTGDIGALDLHGNLTITDRLKDMFICGGFNCYPAEIEKYINQHEAVATSAVIGIADQRMGEVAMAFVVLKPNTRLDEMDLVTWCKEKMANYKVPRQVAFVESLPLNASGKVVKTVLREQAIHYEKEDA